MIYAFDYSYLRGFIHEKYGSNKAFAGFLGISTTALYDRLRKKTPFTQDDIYKVSEAHNLTAEDTDRLFFTVKIRKTE